MTENDNPISASERWAALARLTPARVALGRAGASLPTREVLRFALAHAQARDAVHIPFRAEAVATAIGALSLDTLHVASAAPSRDLYLRRPDLGRRLSPESLEFLSGCERGGDLALVVADGLSSTAIHQNAAPFIAALLPLLNRRKLKLAPVAIASQARVALGDEIGETLGVRVVAVLIGERPGLSSPDSLGVYLTFAPKRGLSDAARNCISNIRPGGLPYESAAFKLAWLLTEALRLQVTGVALKDESDLALEAEAKSPALAKPSPLVE